MEKESHPFYVFCESRMISDETRDEFIMWFRSYLDRYFIIKSEYLYGELASKIKTEYVQDFWNIFIREKNIIHEI